VRFSLAGDIVELLVLTSDEAFLQTMREAVGSECRIWHVAAPEKVSDLLVAGEVGILVLDVQAMQTVPRVFIALIKRRFPQLVMVVAGDREAESSLARLISAGIIYRFMHKPVSPGRAKLFADAAVRRFGEQRERLPRTRPARAPRPVRAAGPTRPAGGGPRLYRRMLRVAALGSALAAILASWIVWRHFYPHAEPPQAAAVGGAIETARKSGAESGRIALLSAQLDASRDQARRAQAPAHRPHRAERQGAS
jgi:hypothetical protein